VRPCAFALATTSFRDIDAGKLRTNADLFVDPPATRAFFAGVLFFEPRGLPGPRLGAPPAALLAFLAAVARAMFRIAATALTESVTPFFAPSATTSCGDMLAGKECTNSDLLIVFFAAIGRDIT
jgi:hypothetical protein